MSIKMTRRISRALKLAYCFFPYDKATGQPGETFWIYLDIASLFDEEEPVLVSLLQRTYLASKLNAADLRSFGFPKTVVDAVTALCKPFGAVSHNPDEILASPLAMKVYLADATINPRKRMPAICTPEFLKTCTEHAELAEVIKAKILERLPDFRLLDEKEAAENRRILVEAIHL